MIITDLTLSTFKLSYITLESSNWTQLAHAYGTAQNIPELISQLYKKSNTPNKKTWDELWSTLVHQGDVYSASFAAVPHFVAIMQNNPLSFNYNFMAIVAAIETARRENNVDLPKELEVHYLKAISLLPFIIAASSVRNWDENLLISSLSAIAAIKGHVKIANKVLEIPELLEYDDEEY